MGIQKNGLMLAILGVIIGGLAVFLFMRAPLGGSLTGQAVGKMDDVAAGKQAPKKIKDEQDGRAFTKIHKAGFDDVCEEVEKAMGGGGGDGTSMTHPCDWSKDEPPTQEECVDCCMTLGRLACHLYCKFQDEHDYDDCMNGALPWPIHIDGCLDKAEDFCGDLCEAYLEQIE